jgi:hypothetical protein
LEDRTLPATSISTATNPSIFGQAVIYTGTAAMSGDHVSIEDTTSGTIVLGSSVASGGAGSDYSITVSVGAPGTHSIQAHDSDNGDTAPLSQVVNKGNTSTSITSSPQPSLYGQTVTFTATVRDTAPAAGLATGSVAFKDGATTMGTGTLDASSRATFSISTLSGGNHSITGSYGGDGNFNGSISGAWGQTVQSPTTTTVVSTPNPSVAGQPASFTVTVAATVSGAGTPFGTVTFQEGAATLAANVSLSSGKATFSSAGLSPGIHTITAVYGGAGIFRTSSGDDSASPQQVNKAASSTAVSASPLPSLYGQTVTFTAFVTAPPPGSGAPTGTVTFLDSGSSFGTGTVDGTGHATFSTSTLAAGNHSITEFYSGDGNFNGSTSGTWGQPVQTPTTTAVTSSPNPSVVGQYVYFTATITANIGGLGTPWGTVTFQEGSTVLAANISLAGAQATFSTPSLSVASHVITAIYSGAGVFQGSTGADSSSPQVVNNAASKTTLVASANPSASGQTVTFTATISAMPPGFGTPTGSVTFQEGSTVLASEVELDGTGHATFSTASLPTGTHTLTAAYSGDGSFQSSSGDTSVYPQVVKRYPSSTVVTSTPAPAVYGQAVTFTASASSPGGTPTGTMNFIDVAPSPPTTQVWLSPDLNSDIVSLFQRPQDWQAARSQVKVLKLEFPALISNPPSGTVSTWDRLQSVQMVQDLQAWNIALAFDTGVIKPQYTSNPNSAVQVAEAAMGNVRQAGGHVTYLSMDEPYYGGVNFTTWSTDMIEDRVASFMQSIKSYDSSVQVGDIEPYPSFDVSSLCAFTDALIARGTTPAFFHLDIEFYNLTVDPNFNARLNADLPVLRDYFAQKNIPFGVILSSGGGTFNLDQDYAVRTLHDIDVVKAAMGVPVQSIFQSWVRDNAGIQEVPRTVPEVQPYTHTWLVNQGMQHLRWTTLAASVPLSGGQATFSISSLTPGGHTILASYGGNSDMTDSSGDDSALPQLVGQDSTTIAVTSSPNASVYGQTATFTATVRAAAPGSGSPTGTVTFMEGAAVLAAGVTLSAGQATFTSAAFSPSSHTITASYGGDANFLAGSGDDSAAPQVVQASTATFVSSSPGPSVFGQPVTFTATVTSGAGTPTGSVTFMEGNTMLAAAVTLAGAVATFTTASLSAGNHTITAAFAGATGWLSSTGDDSATPQIVGQAATALTLASSPGPSTYAQAITFTAVLSAVSPGAGTPTGTVSLTEGSATLAPNLPLTSGVATFSTTGLSAGSHTIAASYSGDGNFLPSSDDDSAVPQVVNPAGTSIAVTSSPGPSFFGQTTTFTAVVSPTAPAGGIPTGSMSFTEGSTTLVSSVLLAGGVATFSTTALAVGSHTITASYSGDGNFQTSMGDDSSAPQQVNVASSTVAVASSPNPSLHGQAVVFTATVSAAPPGAGTPTGTVTFNEGSTVLAAGAPLSGGQATITLSTLTSGSHTITAVYGGDGNFIGSTGDDSAVPQVVQASTNTTLSSSPNSAVFGQPVTFTATVTASGSGTPNGAVTFQEGTATLAASIVLDAGGRATFSTSSLAVGAHSVTATFSGSGNWLASAGDDSASPQVVTQAASAVTLAPSIGPSTYGQAVTFTATVVAGAPGSGTPTGTLSFTEGNATLASGVTIAGSTATFSTSSLTAGTHTVTASYSGDSNFIGGTGEDAGAPQVVNPAGTSTRVMSSPSPALFGQGVTVTAVVGSILSGVGTPTGTANFTEGATTLAAGVTLVGGTATFTTTALSVGNHTLAASYSGDGNFLASAGDDSSAAQIVQGSTSTALTSSPNAAVFGQPVMFTATVTTPAPGTPSGTVTFMEGTTTLAASLAPDGSGRATFGTGALAVGRHTVTAIFSGGGSWLASSGDDSASPQVVNQAATSTALGSSANPAVFGQTVTFTVTVAVVAPGAGTPTGTVTFRDGTTTVASGVTLNATGQGTYSTGALAVGSHTISATYSGDSHFLGSTGNDFASPEQINKASSSTVVASSPKPSVFGQGATFTATIGAVPPGAGTPAGTVSFTEGSTTLASGILLPAGQATFSTSLLSVGSHTITALYSGDGNFLSSSGSDSASPHVVNKASTSTVVASSPRPSVYGQAVVFTATISVVSPGSGAPSGTVTFKEGTTTLASSVALSAGAATFSTSNLAAGSHTITASYSGDGLFLASTGNDAGSPQQVNKASSNTAVSSSVNPSQASQVITFTATVTAVAPGARTPAGTVTFTQGSSTLAANISVNSGGQATFSTSSLAIGTPTITATYSGNGNFQTSTSAGYVETVQKDTTVAALTSTPNPSSLKQTVNFTAVVTAIFGGVPKGTVQFMDGTTVLASMSLNITGQATFTTSKLAAGTHSIQAVYVGNSTYAGSTSNTVVQTVTGSHAATTSATAPTSSAPATSSPSTGSSSISTATPTETSSALTAATVDTFFASSVTPTTACAPLVSAADRLPPVFPHIPEDMVP